MAAKALNNQMTRIVRVNRLKLIETLKTNREKHIAAFTEAMKGYKAVALQKVDEAFQDLSGKLDKRKRELVEHVESFSPETVGKFSDHFTILNAITVSMEVPVSYAEAYDAAVDMATFDTRDELELSGAEFQCFCRDVWDWSYEFTRSTSNYLAAAKQHGGTIPTTPIATVPVRWEVGSRGFRYEFIKPDGSRVGKAGQWNRPPL